MVATAAVRLVATAAVLAELVVAVLHHLVAANRLAEQAHVTAAVLLADADVLRLPAVAVNLLLLAADRKRAVA